MSKKYTTEEFINRAKAVHGDKYDYSKVIYKKATEKVIIICPKHGEFLQAPINHIRKKNGCPMCSADRCRSSTEMFVKKARMIHGNKYDYSKVNYTTNDTEIIITCPIHGDFKQLPSNHLTGSNCPKMHG